MGFSRRRFFGLTAGSAALGLAECLRADAWRMSLATAGAGTHHALTLLDCGSGCTIRESLAGYESALRVSGFPFKRVPGLREETDRVVIVPAAHLTDRSVLRRLKDSLHRGGTLLFESGATFFDELDFDSHRQLMKAEFDIELGAPRQLWESEQSAYSSPYIQYAWPVAAKVRDFSRVIPVDCEDGEGIGRCENLGETVALKKPVGRGTLIFLGSPLGPHLLAGDREAQFWFRRFC